MSVLRSASSIFAGLAILTATAFGAWWIVTAKPPESKPYHPPSAADLKKVNESDLGIITLTEEAEQRLGVKVTPAERKNVNRVRIYGGEVMVPAGRTILVSAPMQGTLQAPEGGVPQAGHAVKKGQHVFSLLPLFSPEASTTLATTRADVEGQVNNARTQLSAMKLALDRAQRLFIQEAGSKRGVEEAQAQHDLALKGLEAAETRLTILTKALGSAATGRAEPIHLESPESGILRNVSALSGQNVPSGGALFEVIDLSEVWVRVPVYVGDLREIAVTEIAQVGNLSMQSGDPTWPAVPVQAPPSANPQSATVDLFFSLKNDNTQLTPGQRVGVKLTLSTGGDCLTVPWGAVLHDLQGGTWVYEVLGPRTYRRQRIFVRYAMDNTAVLATGPAPGTNVVSEGAVEIFGAETGFSK